MKKTNKMATIAENTRRGSVVYIERRVYEDENGIDFVKINNNWFSLDDVRNFPCTFRVHVWF